MRRDPEAGALLRCLDRWLYERPGMNGVDVAEVLRPYRGRAAVHEEAQAEETTP